MTVTEKLSWLVRRMSVMSPREVAYRLGQQIKGQFDSDGWRDPDPDEYRLAAEAGGLLFVPPCELSITDEDQLLAGNVCVFGRWIPIRTGPEFWHTDPFSAAVWPRLPYRDIDYRPGNPTGDVRIIWELNRLQHLFGLALIAGRDNQHRPAAVALFERYLISWREANPPGDGVNYISAMEEALRLVALLHAYSIVRRWVSPGVGSIVVAMAVAHARHIEGRISKYSSTGNHTVAEAVGLLYAGLVLTEHPRAAAWVSAALTLLRQEARKQVDQDGGGVEQATWYLLFVVDLLGLARGVLAHAGKPAESALDAAVTRGRLYLQALATGPLDLPPIGDSDDGYALASGLRLSWQPTSGVPQQVSYRENGLSLVRYGEDDRLIFLHNPLGAPPSYGHGHAACLSVLLRWQGADVLIDPGTYQYGGEPEFRRYFRSTTAHNTATVGGRDQAEQLAPFMWSRPYRAVFQTSSSDPGFTSLLARHDGYRSRGITHWRGVIYRENAFLAIWDSFVGASAEELCLHWHLGLPLGSLDSSRRMARIFLPSGEGVHIEISAGDVTCVRGSADPILGWRSASYGVREPCDVLRVRFDAAPLEPVLTIVWLKEPGSPLEVAALCDGFQQSLG